MNTLKESQAKCHAMRESKIRVRSRISRDMRDTASSIMWSKLRSFAISSFISSAVMPFSAAIARFIFPVLYISYPYLSERMRHTVVLPLPSRPVIVMCINFLRRYSVIVILVILF